MPRASVKIDGKEYKPISIKVRESLTSFGKEVILSVENSSLQNLVGKNEIKTEIFLDNHIVFTGFCDSFDFSMVADAIRINLTLYDNLSLFKTVSCEIDDGNIYSNSKNFPSFIKNVLEVNGFSEVGVINKTNEDLKSDSFTVKEEEKIGEVIDRYCREFQCLIISNAFGDLVIYKPSSANNIGSITVGQKNNGVMDYSYKVNYKDRFGKIIIKTQNTKQLFQLNDDPKNNLSKDFVFTDEDVSPKKKKIIFFKDSVSPEFAEKYGQWLLNMNKGKSFAVNLRMEGFSSNKGLVYAVGDKVSFNSVEMLIDSVNFSFDTNNGAITELLLLDKSTYINREPNFSEEIEQLYSLPLKE